MPGDVCFQAEFFPALVTLVILLFEMHESDVQASIAFRAWDFLTVETEPLVAGDFLYGAVDVARRHRVESFRLQNR